MTNLVYIMSSGLLFLSLKRKPVNYAPNIDTVVVLLFINFAYSIMSIEIFRLCDI